MPVLVIPYPTFESFKLLGCIQICWNIYYIASVCFIIWFHLVGYVFLSCLTFADGVLIEEIIKYFFSEILQINKDWAFGFEFKPLEGRALLVGVIMLESAINLNGINDGLVCILRGFDAQILELLPIIPPLAQLNNLWLEGDKTSVIKADLVGGE